MWGRGTEPGKGKEGEVEVWGEDTGEGDEPKPQPEQERLRWIGRNRERRKVTEANGPSTQRYSLRTRPQEGRGEQEGRIAWKEVEREGKWREQGWGKAGRKGNVYASTCA